MIFSWLKKLMRGFAYLALFLLVVWIIAVQAGCLTLRTPDKNWPEKLRKRGQTLPPQFLDIPDKNGRRIHAIYVSAADSLPLAVLVHGSPGSADAFLNYLADTNLTKIARLLTLDRPGFGYTEGFGKAETSQAAQAAAVQAAVNQLAPHQKVVLVGHSLGAPVIARFAMDFPEQTAGLLLVAGSIDPNLEEHPWWEAAIEAPPLKWLMPKSFRASNREIIFLEEELREMLPFWSKITCPVSVVHAQNDRLVPVGNVDFAKRVLTNCPDLKVTVLPDGDHFILWTRREIVTQALENLLKK
jgi:pimeloyl-ACP methyl ester carboxylesterase